MIDEPGIDGLVFLQLAQEYVEQDLCATVEYDQENYEMVVSIQVKSRNGKHRAGMRINVFQQPESELFEEGNSTQNVNRKQSLKKKLIIPSGRDNTLYSVDLKWTLEMTMPHFS